MDKQEQFLQERDAHLKMVEVFITNGVTVFSNHYFSGNIYLVEKYKADKLIDEGNAIKISFPQLDSIEKKLEARVDKLEKDIEKLISNQRLTYDAKSEARQDLINQADQELKEMNKSYMFWIDELIKDEKNKSIDFNSKSDYNHDKLEEKVGIIISEIEMSFSFDDAIRKLEDHLEFIDEPTSIRLLSKFTIIKDILMKKGRNIQGLSRKISGVYNKIKDSSQNKMQEQATVKFRMLQAIKEKKEHYTAIPRKFHHIKGKRY
ncbi:hypothetical protein [Oceanobacillus kimchii]|uniref:hypothetical protein n=1 Tax=Oceanobacillus kimchii TaxID=746691 RepID=UPI00232CB136|nr:hypothetical protein [Oceanobacillus kimchii]